MQSCRDEKDVKNVWNLLWRWPAHDCHALWSRILQGVLERLLRHCHFRWTLVHSQVLSSSKMQRINDGRRSRRGGTGTLTQIWVLSIEIFCGIQYAHEMVSRTWLWTYCHGILCFCHGAGWESCVLWFLWYQLLFSMWRRTSFSLQLQRIGGLERKVQEWIRNCQLDFGEHQALPQVQFSYWKESGV